MALTQDWRVISGDTTADVQADNWLGALAAALPALGLDLGAMARLVCATEADGSATARDPRAGIEISIRPVGQALPPTFEMPESSFAAVNVPFLRARPAPPPPPAVQTPTLRLAPPPAADAVPPLRAEPPPAPRAPVAEAPPVRVEPVRALTMEVEGPGQELRPAPVRAPAPLDDRLEELFMRLGEINAAPGVRDACAAALRIANELIPAEAGALLVRTRTGDALRFRAAFGPAAASVLDTTIPLDRGIAGFVFQLGVGVSIGDAHRDARHYSRVDRSTGYTTRELLATPVRAETSGVYGVLELINPPRPFGADDLELASRVAVTLGNFFQGMDA